MIKRNRNQEKKIRKIYTISPKRVQEIKKYSEETELSESAIVRMAWDFYKEHRIDKKEVV